METAVQNGAKWLDSIKKDWHKKVNLKNIDLELFNGCVIGQVFGEEFSRVLCNQTKFALTHGFCLNGKRSDYLKLSSVWAIEIEKRKEVKK